MISHLSDDLANRSTIAFCQRLSAKEASARVEEDFKKFGQALFQAANSPSVKKASDAFIAASAEAHVHLAKQFASVFRIDGTIEHYPVG